MKKKKTPEIDPAAEVIQDKPAITFTAEATEGVALIHPSVATKTVAVHVLPRFDYEFLTAQGPYATPDFNDKFRKLGDEGWEFVGSDGYGRSVFKRPVTS